MHVAIVEPHYDDAWLSLGGTILLHPHVRFTIVSVSRDETYNPVDRTKLLAERLPNLRTHALELADLGWSREAVEARARHAGKADARELFLHESRLDSLASLARRIEACAPDAGVFALPLGLFHPMHEVVAEIPLRAPTIRYLEYPYRFYPSQAPRASAPSTAVDVSAVAQLKLRMFEETYPEQRYVLSMPECAVRLEDADERLLASEAALLPPW